MDIKLGVQTFTLDTEQADALKLVLDDIEEYRDERTAEDDAEADNSTWILWIMDALNGYYHAHSGEDRRNTMAHVATLALCMIESSYVKGDDDDDDEPVEDS